jgi:ketosteroid isomerase-like protein
MEHIGRLAEKDLTVNLKALVAEGDTVVAITEVTAGGETGEDADVFTVRNGKTVSARVHGDTALLERVYGKKGSRPDADIRPNESAVTQAWWAD